MSDDRAPFVSQMQRELQRNGVAAPGSEQRHPVRRSAQYQQLKMGAVTEVDALCERLVQQLRESIEEIDDTIAAVGSSHDEQLARGAVLDVFAAAAEVLKKQVRGGPDESS